MRLLPLAALEPRGPQLQYAALTLVCLLTACGGSSDSSPTPPTPTPPTPPAPPTVPATIAIVAGDGQSAAAGQQVTVAPAVVVRTASGAPVAGTAVQFVVSSGGGSIQGASPTTDAQGIARVGAWSLGTSGDQRLTAQAGSAAPVVFQATIRVDTAPIVVLIGSDGGSFELTTEGNPFRGLKVTVPSGAFEAPGSLRLRVVTGGGPAPSLPAGYQIVGPALEVATELPRGRKLLTLDIPASQSAGRGVGIAFFDPASGAIEVMPTVARSATSIRVMTTHLRADLLLRAGSVGSVRTAAFGASPASIGHLIRFEFPVPLPPVPAVVTPALARWPVVEHGTSLAPNGHGIAIAALQTVFAARGGAPLGTLFKPLATPGFYPDEAPMAVALTSQRRMVEGIGTVAADLAAALRVVVKAERDEFIGNTIGTSLGVGGMPVVVGLGASGAAPTVFVNAIASAASEIALLDPARSDLGQLVRNVASGFGDLSSRSAADVPATTTTEVVPLSSFVVPFERLADLATRLSTVLSLEGTAREALTRELTTEAAMGEVVVAQVAVAGGAAVEAKRGNVVIRTTNATVSLRIPGKGAAAFIMHLPTTGAVSSESSGPPLASTAIPEVAAAGEGVAVELVATPHENVDGRRRQTNAKRVQVTKAPFRVTPEQVTLTDTDTEVDLVGEIPAPPEFYRVRWDWGDGQTNTNIFSANANHIYQVNRDYEIIVTLETDALDPGVTHATIGVDTVQVRGAVPAWQITAIQDPDQLIDLGIEGESGEVFDLLQRLLRAPRAGVITIEDEGSERLLKLRVLPSSLWADPACCPIARQPGELQLPLGVQPTEPVVVDPFFAGWDFNGWSQSTRSLSSGTMTSQVVLGTTTYDIKDVGVRVGPRGGVRLAATRNGTAMTGTITFTLWFVDFETEVLDSPPETFVLPFSAVRIR